MTPVPLDQLGLRDHRSALWWLGLLYRRPVQFCVSLGDVHGERRKIARGAMLLLHALPYMIAISLIGRVMLPALSGSIQNDAFASPAILIDVLFSIFRGSGLGIAIGIVGGIARKMIVDKDRIDLEIEGIAWGIAFGIAFGIALGIAVGITGGIIGAKITGRIDHGIALGISLGIILGIFGGISFRIDRRPALPSGFWIVAVIVMGLIFGIIDGTKHGIERGIAMGIAFCLANLRLYYQAFSWALHWPVLRGHLYPWHPVAWDDMCSVPFPGLGRLLAAYAEHDRRAAEAEIERLIDHYPSQRMQVLIARTMLVARDAAQEANLARIDGVAARLPEGERTFLQETVRVKEWIAEIVGLQRRLDAADRPLFRGPLAEALFDKIENFQHRVAGLREPLASEFRAAGERWLKIARRQRDEVQRALEREPTPPVFRAGDPVNREQEAFVARTGVFGELERQIMLGTGCPGIVLYGRRRTGKSTVLLNLSGFLPATVLPLVVSMQDPKAFTSLPSILALLAERTRMAMGSIAPESRIIDGLPRFFELFAACNQRLEAEGRRLLVAFDEYESLDVKIGEGVIPRDFLDLLRESIQSHRSVTWMFAGSHEITELSNAPWTSYLVSARTIEVPLFTPQETALLLTDPLKHSRFWSEGGRQRPRFTPAFWGEGGIECIHAEAGGWPHLVQLIAETVVDLLNDTERREADAALLEQALAKAVVRGHNVLYELLRRECTLPGEWEYLRGFSTRELQAPAVDIKVNAALRRRLLIVEENGECRLRVPLMRRWLVERGALADG